MPLQDDMARTYRADAVHLAIALQYEGVLDAFASASAYAFECEVVIFNIVTCWCASLSACLVDYYAVTLLQPCPACSCRLTQRSLPSCGPSCSPGCS